MKKLSLIILSLLTLPYIVGLIVALFFAYASPLVLVTPTSSGSGPTWAEFFIFCTCPITFIIGTLGGWLSFFQKRYRLAFALALLPLLETVLLVIASTVFKGIFR
jgi:hypothetical protein